MANSFLRDYQMDAVKKMRTGCILNGGTGSGKSRTGLYYYFKEQGGCLENQETIYMKNPKDLYIIEERFIGVGRRTCQLLYVQ